MGSLEEGGKEPHVGLMELKPRSWFSLIFVPMCVCFGSVPGITLHPNLCLPLGATQPGEFQALNVRGW